PVTRLPARWQPPAHPHHDDREGSEDVDLRGSLSCSRRCSMDLALSDDDVRTLRGLLHDYLPELKFEAARAHGAALRHRLYKRQTWCERLLDELREASLHHA